MVDLGRMGSLRPQYNAAENLVAIIECRDPPYNAGTETPMDWTEGIGFESNWEKGIQRNGSH